jgi:AraC-like DNA-binding protein
MTKSTQPLSNFNVLSSQDVDAARAAMAGIYGDLNLNPLGRSDSFGLRLNAAPLGRLLITSMRWDGGIEAQSPALDGCFDFCAALSGAGEARIGRRAVGFAGYNGVVLSPVHPMHCKNEAALSALNVGIPSDLAETHIRALTGKDLGEPLDFDPEMRLDGRVAASWRLVHHIIGELERNPSLLSNPLVAERFSETLLTSLLCSQPSNYSEWLQRDALPAEPRYRHRGCAPLKFLEEIRLRRVRDALLKGLPGTIVKEVGLRWGFNNPSGLSRAYGRRFGETPSETLRRVAKGR